MEANRPTQSPPLADQVYEIILERIISGEYPPGSRLPSENELSKTYGVSRPTIRTAFSRLGELGYVIKKQGVGTFVTDTPNILNPLFLSYDVMERISARGFEPGFKQLETKFIEADEQISKKLDIPVKSRVLNIHKLFTADGDPIIYFKNYIPEWVYQGKVSKEKILQPGATQPFFRFFAECCHSEIKFLTSVIQPKKVNECQLPDAFSVYPGNTNVLEVEDIGYNGSNTRVFLSIEHLLKEASVFYVVRHVGKI